jgi:hypothetical protein
MRPVQKLASSPHERSDMRDKPTPDVASLIRATIPFALATSIDQFLDDDGGYLNRHFDRSEAIHISA